MDMTYKVVIDNNVILDYFLNRTDYFDVAKRILQLSEQREIKGIISSNSVTDIYYFLKKYHGHKTAIEMLKDFSIFLDIVKVEKKDILKATDLDFNDLEDALVSYCAEREKADYIVTRNGKDFLESRIEALSPEEFFKKTKIR